MHLMDCFVPNGLKFGVENCQQIYYSLKFVKSVSEFYFVKHKDFFFPVKSVKLIITFRQRYRMVLKNFRKLQMGLFGSSVEIFYIQCISSNFM